MANRKRNDILGLTVASEANSSVCTRGCMAKVFTIPVVPKVGRRRRERSSDPRYVDGQRLLVEAMKYLAQSDPVQNRDAVQLLSEHVRTRFRMTDSPLS